MPSDSPTIADATVVSTPRDPPAPKVTRPVANQSMGLYTVQSLGSRSIQPWEYIVHVLYCMFTSANLLHVVALGTSRTENAVT